MTYQTGQKIKAIVTAVTGTGYWLKLEDGTKAKMQKNDAGPFNGKVNDSGEFYIKRVGQGYVVLKYTSDGIQKPQTGQTGNQGNATIHPVSPSGTAVPANNEKPWRNWPSVTPGHDQILTVLRTLRRKNEHFDADMRSAAANYSSAIQQSKNAFDSSVRDTEQKFDLERIQAASERKSDLDEVDRKIMHVNELLSAVRNFKANTDYLMKNYQGNQYKKAEQDAARVQAELNNEKKIIENLHAERISEAQARKSKAVNTAAADKVNRDLKAENIRDTSRKDLTADFKKDISSGFGKNAVAAYCRNVNNAGIDPKNYICPQTLPQFIRFGEIVYPMPAETPDQITAADVVSAQMGRYGQRIGKRYLVKMPYCQNRDEGSSLLIRYGTKEERQYAGSIMQPLLLNMFMSYPAGKLEATLIDPQAAGQTFIDIVKLSDGADTARLINSKIFKTSDEIEKALSILNNKITSDLQSYGSERVKLFEMEPCKVLCIVDFPARMTTASLNHLLNITNNAKKMGVTVFMTASNDGLNQLSQGNAQIVRNILSNLHEVSVLGSRLKIEGTDNEHLYIVPDMMKTAFDHKDSIIQTIRDESRMMKFPEVKFAELYQFNILDSNNWFRGESRKFQAPVGIYGASTVVDFEVGGPGTDHHALVAGITGAGKTNFFNVMIASTLINYPPEEVQIYLLDFKEGAGFVDYSQYRLPNFKAISLKSEAEFGLQILQELCNELKSRAASLHIREPKPRILLVIDEVQEMFNKADSDMISQILTCFRTLVEQGREESIYVILGSNNFRQCTGLENLYTNMGIRIGLAGSSEVARQIFSSGNSDIPQLASEFTGKGIYNNKGGEDAGNRMFRIAHLPHKQLNSILAKMDEYYNDPVIAQRYASYQTRAINTYPSNDAFSCFNKLIRYGEQSLEDVTDQKDAYGLMIGVKYTGEPNLIAELRKEDGDNLLIISENESIPASICGMSMLSIMQKNLILHSDPHRQNIMIIDLLSDPGYTERICTISHFAEEHPDNIVREELGGIDSMLKDVYGIVEKRLQNPQADHPRLFFIFLGIDKVMHKFRSGMYSQNENLNRLMTVLTDGPSSGVNSIVWAESLEGLRDILPGYLDLFHKRVMYSRNEKQLRECVNENKGGSLTGFTSVYFDQKSAVRAHFRTYDLLYKDWADEYFDRYDEIAGKRKETV